MSLPPRAVTTAPPKSSHRVDHDQTYVLHAMPYRETSLLVQAFSQRHGRVTLVAKGAKRRGSALRSALVYFAPLAFSWSGMGEVKTLVRVEWMGGLAPLAGKHLLSAYYLNELILRLLPREDAHPRLFQAYEEALKDLSADCATGDALRRFEWRLLRDIGYAPILDRTQTGAAIEPDAWYRVDPQAGVFPVDTARADQALQGVHLLAIAREAFSEGQGNTPIKNLLRMLLNYHMDNKPLFTRQVLLALQKR